MTAPIDIYQLIVRLGTVSNPDDPRLQVMLDDAWAAVVARAGQSFTVETSTLVPLKVQRSKVRLPQRPVTAVTTVQDLYGNDVVYTWDGGDTLYMSNLDLTWAFEPYRFGLAAVKVTYTHGYADIPADIVAVTCQMAARAYGVAAERTGYNQEQTGPFMVGIGTAAASGAVGMLSGEKEVIDRYARQAGVTFTGVW